MSNNDSPQPDHLAIVDGLTPIEHAAWMRLQIAEHELAVAKQHVIEVTNREAGKRRMRHLLRVVHPMPLNQPPESGTAQQLTNEGSETQNDKAEPGSQKKAATSRERSP